MNTNTEEYIKRIYNLAGEISITAEVRAAIIQGVILKESIDRHTSAINNLVEAIKGKRF